MTATTPEHDTPATAPPPLRPLSWSTKAVMLCAGALWPAFCFLIAANGTPDGPTWQSGNLKACAFYLLSGQTSFVFYPFLLYAVICLALLLTDEPRFARRFAVRLGIYTGVLLAYHFAAVLSMSFFSRDLEATWLSVGLIVGLVVPAATAIVACGVMILWLLGIAWSKATSTPASATSGSSNSTSAERWIVAFIVLLVVLGSIVVAVSGGAVFILPFMFLFMGGPFFTLIVFAVMSWRVARLAGGRFQIRLIHLLAAFTWLSAYLAAWREAIVRMFALYHALPVEPPESCYVATAAAQGHRWLVGGRVVRCRSGRLMRVNRQLATLKCGELALKATFPRGHGVLRLIYDRIGPRLARRLRHPLAADLAFLSLKPAEWATRATLGLLLGDLDDHVARIYKSTSE